MAAYLEEFSSDRNDMNCIKFEFDNLKLHYTKHEIPRIENDTDVIVKIAYAGVCGTDSHIVEGKFFATDEVILGHEMCGTVHETSGNIDGPFEVGDKVVVNPNRYCLTCLQCRRGRYNLCEEDGQFTCLGIVKNGGWAEYCKVHVDSVFKLPESINLRAAVLCEPLSCITHGLDKISPIHIGSTVLILGAGIIGMLWCSVLNHLGHRNVYVSEPNEKRRKNVEKLNLNTKCTPWSGIKDMAERNKGWMVDVCVDCSGSVEAIQSVLPILRPGATLCIFGVANPEKKLDVLPFQMFDRELTVMGIKINTASSFEKAIALMESLGSKYFDYDKLSIKTLKLEEYEEAERLAKTGEYSKIVYEM